jgi:hypothetical protein
LAKSLVTCVFLSSSQTNGTPILDATGMSERVRYWATDICKFQAYEIETYT